MLIWSSPAPTLSRPDEKYQQHESYGCTRGSTESKTTAAGSARATVVLVWAGETGSSLQAATLPQICFKRVARLQRECEPRDAIGGSATGAVLWPPTPRPGSRMSPVSASRSPAPNATGEAPIRSKTGRRSRTSDFFTERNVSPDGEGFTRPN